MNNFSFYSPTKFIFGKGTENEVGDTLKSYDAQKVMVVHYGPEATYEAPIMEKVFASLRRAAVNYVDFPGVRPNPTEEHAKKGAEIAKEQGVDYLLAVGGGSVIDTAKFISIAFYDDGDVWETYYAGNKKVGKTLPVGAINTCPGTGSEGSNSSVIERGHLKRSCNDDAIRCKFAILDPELAYTLPAFNTASIAVDTMAHAHERYFTRSGDNYLTDNLGESIFRTVIKYLPKVLDNPKDYEARCQLTWAANLAHNDTVGVGRVVDGTVHGIESEIGGMYNSVHGAGCACVTPAWMKYVYKADPRRFVRYFNQVWGMEVDPYDPDGMIEEGIQRQKDFYVSVGIPVHSSELGVRDEDIPVLVSTVRRGPNGKAGHFMELDDQDLTNIFMLMK